MLSTRRRQIAAATVLAIVAVVAVGWVVTAPSEDDAPLRALRADALARFARRRDG